MYNYLFILFSVFSFSSFAMDGSPELRRKKRETRAPTYLQEYEPDVNLRVLKKSKSKKSQTKSTIKTAPNKRKSAQKLTAKPRKTTCEVRTDYEPRLIKKESTWLLSLSVPGQNGLFAGEFIGKGQFIGWYEGRIYTSEREINQLAPAPELIGTVKEYSYFHKVEDPKTGRYLYSIDGFQSEGRDLSKAAYVNHKPHVIANAEFRSAFRKGAPHDAGMAIFATKDIAKGEEITVDYGIDYERHLQEIAPCYREFLVENHPKSVVKETREDDQHDNSMRPSQLLELFNALFAEVTHYEISNADAKRMGQKYIDITEAWKKLDARLSAFRVPECSEDADDQISELNFIIDGYTKLDRWSCFAEKTSWAHRYLTFKNQQRLAMAYWRKTLMLVAQQLHSGKNSTKPIKTIVAQQNEAFDLCQKMYRDSLTSDVKFGHAYRILGESIEKGLRAVDGFRTEEAEAFKDMGDEILREDRNPLKSKENKFSDRALAIDYYFHALYLLKGEEEEPEVAALKGAIYATLGECSNDSVHREREKAEEYLEAAIEWYETAKRGRDGEAFFDKDLQVAKAQLKKLKH